MAAQLSYDVFISCQGEDTHNRFTSSLESALRDEGFHTFIHHRGEHIYSNVINKSKIGIIIFFENFSKHPLHEEELPFIFRSFRQPNQPDRFLFPVYHNMTRGDVIEAAEFVDRSHYRSPDEIDEYDAWKDVLFTVANIPGWYFKYRDGNESKLIKAIVDDVKTLCDGVPLHKAISDVVPDHDSLPLLEVDQESMPISQRISDVVPDHDSLPLLEVDQESMPISQRISDVVPDHDSLSRLEVDQESMPISQRVFYAERTWRLVGLMSGVVGLLCYALSPSFNRLFGRWEPFKVFLYLVVCLVILAIIVFAQPASPSARYVKLKKTCTTFAVLMIISVYSFFYDKAVNGKPNILSVISNAAFALMSLSLHELISSGFEIGAFSNFLGWFTIQLLTINLMLIFVAIIYGSLLFVMRSSLDSKSEVDIDREHAV